MTTPAPTPRNTKFLAPLVVIIALVVAALFAIRSQIQSKTPIADGTAAGTPATADMRIGAILPDFKLHPFSKGAGPTSASQLKAKVSLINFWATWCEACMIEMPSIIKLHQAYKSRGFDVVAVDLDTNPDAVVPRAIQKYGMGFTVYTDLDSKLADFFQIQAIPLSVVIDRNRKILMIENEGLDWNGQEFRAALEKWLAG